MNKTKNHEWIGREASAGDQKIFPFITETEWVCIMVEEERWVMHGLAADDSEYIKRRAAAELY